MLRPPSHGRNSETSTESEPMANWPSRVDYKLPEQATEEITFFVENTDNLDQIIDSAMKQRPQTAFQDIIESISKDTNIPANDIRIIINSIENIQLLSEDLGSVEEGINRLQIAVAKDLAEKLQTSKTKISDAVRRYGRDNPVTITLKAQRLTYARERLIHDTEIITDARPVFDTTGSRILEYIITHTLSLSAMIDGGLQQRYLSLDSADIINLRNACDRAIVKARTLKEALSSSSAPAVIVRDEDSSCF